MNRSAAAPIPRFFLFGEAPEDAEANFLHIEPIALRSRPSGWTIRPHSHADLHHVLLIRGGSGEMTVDGERFAFGAPTLLVTPSRSVHGFRFAPETDGWVLTLAVPLIEELATRDASFRALFAAALPPGRPDSDQVDDIARLLDGLSRELAWQAPAAKGSIEGRLMVLLAELVRTFAASQTTATRPIGDSATLVARFRALLELRFRTDWRLERYAEALGVTVARLRRACVETTGITPLAFVRDRRILEAKRALAYTTSSMAEVAFGVGIEDPAYFSRLFAKSVGEPPAAYRRRIARRHGEMAVRSNLIFDV